MDSSPQIAAKTTVILRGARGVPSEQREEYLRHACGDDDALRGRVQQLLEFCGEIENLLPEASVSIKVPCSNPNATRSDLRVGRADSFLQWKRPAIIR